MVPASALVATVATVAAVALVGAPAFVTGGSGTPGSGTAGSVAAGSVAARLATARAVARRAPVTASDAGTAADAGVAAAVVMGEVLPDEAVRQAWEWPLSPRPEVLRRFDVGPAQWSAGHRGVDLAAAPGAVVRAPAAGVVRFVGVVAGRPVLSIAHDDGLISTYEPVTSVLRPGEQVVAGAQIGTLSALPGHCFPGSCLHWGVRRGTVYVDPLSLVRGVLRPIVLKPLAGLGPAGPSGP